MLSLLCKKGRACAAPPCPPPAHAAACLPCLPTSSQVAADKLGLSATAMVMLQVVGGAAGQMIRCDLMGDLGQGTGAATHSLAPWLGTLPLLTDHAG